MSYDRKLRKFERARGDFDKMALAGLVGAVDRGEPNAAERLAEITRSDPRAAEFAQYLRSVLEATKDVFEAEPFQPKQTDPCTPMPKGAAVRTGCAGRPTRPQ